jgi:nucleotide-binding universal stress UspA family protein
MRNPKIILVPTDFGEPSEAALLTAIEYAKVFGSEIVLMHAFEIPIVGFPDGAIVATAELTNRILEGAQTGLDRQIAAHQGCGVTIRGIIKQGEAFRMVNETAGEIGAGLIAMGTHGRKGLSRALIGSVAEKVVRTAQVPVLTVHSGDVAKEELRHAPDAAGEPRPAPVSSRNLQNGRDVREPVSHR